MHTSNWTYFISTSGEMMAQIFEGLLRSNGIPVLLAQEAAGKVFALTNLPLGTVDIFVPEEYLPQAQEIFSAYKAGELDDTTLIDIDVAYPPEETSSEISD